MLSLTASYRTRLFLSIITLAGGTQAHAQTRPPGFVVTAAGDTLRGTLRPAGAGSLSLRRPEGLSTYTTADLRAYTLEPGEAYTRYQVRLADGTEAARFARPLVVGPARLLTGPTTEPAPALYLQSRGPAQLYELTPANWQLVLTQQLPLCPGFSVSAQATTSFEFSPRSLKAVVARYNKCVQPQQPAGVVPDKASGKFTFGLVAGADAVTFHFDAQSFQGTTSSRRVGYQAGVFSALELPKGLMLRAELLLQQQQATFGPQPEFTGTALYSGSRIRELSFTSAKLNALIGTTLGKSQTRPFVNGGLSVAAYLRKQGTETLQYSAGGPPMQVSNVGFDSRIGAGGLVGGGLEHSLASGRTLAAEIRYSYSYVDLSQSANLLSRSWGLLMRLSL